MPRSLDWLPGPIDTLFDVLVGTFGPFVVPAAVFLAGAIGYGVLLALQRRRESNPSGSEGSSPADRRKD